MPDIALLSKGKAELCGSVLDDLPEWFGIPDAKRAYVEASDRLPMLGCRVDGEWVGFVSLMPRTRAAVEIHVMGVRRRHHRCGAGRALIDGAVRWASDKHLHFLTVKTLAAEHPDPNYAVTRCFYEAVGFLPLEVFPGLWDEGNPCLLMVRPL